LQQYSFAKKLQSQTVTREKLRKTLLVQKIILAKNSNSSYSSIKVAQNSLVWFGLF